MKYARILSAFHNDLWLLRPETISAMRDLLRLQAEGLKWSEDEIRIRIAEANKTGGYVPRERKSEFRMLPIASVGAFESHIRAYSDFEELPAQARSGKKGGQPGTVAVIPVTGIIAHRMAMVDDISGPGGASTQRITQQFRAALADDNCKAIVFDVDSPGGSVEGIPELAAEIFRARKQKPIVAVSNAQSASAAYWLTTSAGEVYCTPSGQVGSIGVYIAHQDESKALEMEGLNITLISAGKYKVEGNPTEPLTAESKAALQSKVDTMYGMFVKAVSQNRNVSQTAVKDGFGEGRMVLAKQAAAEKMIDAVASMDEVLEKYGVSTGSPTVAAAAQPAEPRLAKLEEPAGMVAGKPKDDADDEECECSCEACKAGNCSACTNAECNDPECGHGPRAVRDAAEIAAGDALESMQRRRRQLDMMR